MTWLASPGTYLAGQEAIDTLDILARDMERKWGADRLRCLVPEELRTKFDAQRVKTNRAIWHGELIDVQRETVRMANAWRALNHYAEINAKPLNPSVWEVALEDGTVAQIVKESDLAGLVAAQEAIAGRQVALYTLEEVGRLLSKFPTLYQAKVMFPGTEVTRVRMTIGDPLDAVEAEP